MTASAEGIQIIEGDFKTIGEVISTSLNRLGWHVKFANAKMRQVSAVTETSRRRGQDMWRYSFDAKIRWHKDNGKVRLEVSVSEKEMDWTTDDCAKHCDEILKGIAADAAILAESEQENEPSDAYGSARWSSLKDLEAAGYIDAQKNVRRLLLGPLVPGKINLEISAQDTEMHAVVCGPTGTGKTSSIFIPNLIERIGTSAIVTEATAGRGDAPDLFSKTSGFRKMAGHEIYYFNPDDMRSVRINPISHIKTYAQAAEVASLIIKNTSSPFTKDAKVWEDSESQLLIALILYAVGEGKDLGTIRRLLRRGADHIGVAIMGSMFQEAKDEFWGFYNNTTEGFRNSVLCGLMARLNLWVNPRVVALTETTDLDFNALTEQLFTFYFAVPAKQEHLKPLAALIFNFLLESSLDKQFKKPLALFLDEFLNYGYIPGMPEALTIIRHKHIPITLGIQDHVQLRKVYGDDNATLLFGQPGTKIFFKPRDLGTAKKIAEMLGTKTVVERKLNTSGHILEREFGRPLLNPGELMSLEKNQTIVLTPSTPPVKMTTFRWQDYVTPTSYPPPEFRLLDVDEELERTCRETASKPDWQKNWEAKQDKPKASKPEPKPASDERGEKPSAQTPTPKDDDDEDQDDTDLDDWTVPNF
ncbi:MAG TPA: type IV secretory system conjugative DNA transfer family protein [Oculatellaceae cyanobacterium]